MKLYPRLAWSGVMRSKRMVLPYWMTCTLCITMFCILHSLSVNSFVRRMKGGGSLSLVLGLGVIVMGIFSVIFLFYTSSLLIRHRKKEFGLYNVLGLNKGAIGRILLRETLITAACTLVVGSICGIALSKLSEMILARLVHATVTTGITIPTGSVLLTLILFGTIYLVILLNNLRQIRFAPVTELLRSEQAGEKAPKANWVIAVLGLLLLGVAYYVAVSIREPLTALLLFFAAVVLVIIATYMLMISGSVSLCRFLQKRKKYYYKARHFVSVSSMAWRMKRNGAGLASICILATMVLVMLSSTTCLYFGAEDSINTMYPHDINLTVYLKSGEETADNLLTLRTTAQTAAEANCTSSERISAWSTYCIYGLLDGNTLQYDSTTVDPGNLLAYDNLTSVCFVSVDDYNALTCQSLTMSDGEVYAAAMRTSLPGESLTINGVTWQINGAVEGSELFSLQSNSIFPCILLVVPDLEAAVRPINGLADAEGRDSLSLSWYMGIDVDDTVVNEHEAGWAILDAITGQQYSFIDSYQFTIRSEMVDEFYGTYGGFFFLGVLLSIVFLAAAALIMYYKQVTEGYEDAHRFDIMMKLGMTRRDIWKSIRSQMLTVFFVPIGLSVLHLAFAFPMLRKMLMLFSINNLPLLLTTAGISTACFAVFYAVVYRRTAVTYFHIVSGNN